MRQNSSKKGSNRGNGVVQKTNKTGKNVKTKKIKNTRLFKLLRIIVIVLIIIVIFNLSKEIFKKTPEKITVMLGDKKVSLENNVEIDEDNNIYISIDDIRNLYDKDIYYNDNILITTYNKHIAVFEKDKSTMKVNDVVQEINGTLKEKNGIVYLPFSEMEDIYDFDETYNKETKVLSIDSKLKMKQEAVVLKNTNLKEEPKTFSKTIEKVKRTQYVTVLAQMKDGIGYYLVRTKAGNVGYILAKKISKPETLWEDMEYEKLKDVKILNDFNTVDSKYEILQDAEKNSIVTPNLFNIVNEEKVDVQKIIDLNSDKFITYKDWASGSNVNICPTVTLNCSMSKVCENYETRSLVINTLYNELVSNNLNMICIDFSEIDDVEGLYRFVLEMVPRFRCAGMKVLVKNNGSLDNERLDNIVDYVID